MRFSHANLTDWQTTHCDRMYTRLSRFSLKLSDQIISFMHLSVLCIFIRLLTPSWQNNCRIGNLNFGASISWSISDILLYMGTRTTHKKILISCRKKHLRQNLNYKLICENFVNLASVYDKYLSLYVVPTATHSPSNTLNRFYFKK